MAMAALHLLPKNTGRKMHPTISHQFKTSLSPSLPSFCSFPLFPSRSACQRTTVAGLNIIKCFNQQKYKWSSKGSGGIPPTPTPTPRQLTNIQAYLLISIKQMVQGTRRVYCDFSFGQILKDSWPNKDKEDSRPNERKRDREEIRDPNNGEPDHKRKKLEVQSEVVQSEACTTTTITTTIGDHHHHHHLSNSVNIGLEIMGDGEYVVKIKRSRSSTSSTHDEEADEEVEKQMAQNAAMLILHGELLQDMGKKLLAQTQASPPSI